MFFLILLSFFLITMTASFLLWLHSTPLRKSSEKFDVILVLGYRCFDNKINSILLSRLRVALKLYKSNTNSFLIVTGGKVGSNISESVLMKEYLVKQGIPPCSIVEETKAVDSIENIKNCAALVGEQSCLLVSSSFHLRRVKYICKKWNFTCKFYAERSLKQFFQEFFLSLHELKTFITTYHLLKNYFLK